jgi:hypothetical protein
MKCTEKSTWCSFSAVNLTHAHFTNLSGVYIIWHAGPAPKVVRIGQGVIKDRLAAHRLDPEIIEYAPLGLYVTWAQVHGNQQGGVENFLADTLSPIVGERFPDTDPIEVNLPWP